MMSSPHDAAPFGRYEPHGSIQKLLGITRQPRRTWLGRRLGFICRTLGITMLRGNPLDVEAFGAKMRLYPAHNVSEKNLLFTPHLFDPDERDLLARQICRGFTFIDVGANVGGYSLFAAALAGPHARILAIEPQPDVFDRLIYNVRQNPFGTVKALRCAVTDQDGEVTLFVDPANNGQSSVRFVTTMKGSASLKVPSKTLRTILADEGIDRLDVLKVDVEGAEDLIVEPFFRDVQPELWPKLLILDSPPGRQPFDTSALAEGGAYRQVLRNRSNIVYALRS